MISELFDRPPPHDVDAERGVIGGLLADLGQLNEVAFLMPDDFHVADHGLLFDHLRQFPQNGDGPVDETLLVSWLKSQIDVDRVAPLIGELFGKHPVAAHVAHYGRIVKTAADKRRIIMRLSDGLQHCYNGRDDAGALVAEITAGLETLAVAQEERFHAMSMEELVTTDFSADHIVQDVLAVGETMFIGGMFKSSKTSIAMDLMLSMATGTPFLDHFPVLREARSVYFLGEGNGRFAQEVCNRVARQKGVDAAGIKGARLCDKLPNMFSAVDLRDVASVLKRHQAEFAIFDPLYRGAGDVAESASNSFKMGAMFAAVQEVVREAGATPIIIHHFKKTRDELAPATLGDLTHAGVSEFAGQWALLNRTRKYDGTRPGHHDFRLVAGSRMMGETPWAFTLEEGSHNDIGGRKWEPEVTPWTDAVAAQTTPIQAAKARQDAKLEERCQVIVDVLGRLSRANVNLIRDHAQLGRGETWGRPWRKLLSDRVIGQDGEMKAGNGEMVPAYCLED